MEPAMMLSMTTRRDALEQAGLWIRSTREDCQLTQADVAERIGVSTQTISNWERGLNALDDKKAAQLAEALGLSIVETRRGLGMYVPEDNPEVAHDRPVASTLDAIRRDMRLSAEARRSLLKLYEMFARLTELEALADKGVPSAREQLEAEAREIAESDLPSQGRKRRPGSSRRPSP